jgi:hypothetical protein
MASAFHRMNSVRQSKTGPLTDNQSVRTKAGSRHSMALLARPHARPHGELDA